MHIHPLTWSATWLWLLATTGHAQVCTREYAPVCGQVTSEPGPRTFANRCLLDHARAQWLSAGDCATATPHMPGSDTDAHGCKPSAGYTWNSELASCIRPWMSRVVTLQVSAKRPHCQGLVPCLLVRELPMGKAKSHWVTWQGDIEGFTPQPGVRYTLRVRKDRIDNPPADSPDVRYSLRKVIVPAKQPAP